MRRREFITALGSVVAWPLALRAQQPAMPVIGFLSTRSPDESARVVLAFQRGLAQGGYADGQNVTIEYRWALSRYDRLGALASELVHRPVNLIVAVGADPSARAAKAATATIPIVATFSTDPVAAGLVSSFSRPGGNLTGIAGAQDMKANADSTRRFLYVLQLLRGRGEGRVEHDGNGPCLRHEFVQALMKRLSWRLRQSQS
jgi:ABC-type uncharacterized transport system substrate-binding protein